MPQLQPLRHRAQFLAVAAKGRKAATTGLVMQCLKQENDSAPRLGLTASRKVGNAVLRNRARRRLRALAREVMTDHAQPGHDYVLIAKHNTVERDYAALRADLTAALRKLGLWRE